MKQFQSVPFTESKTESKTETAFSSRTRAAARCFESHEVAAMAWASVSKYPAERGTAASRFRSHVQRGLDPELLGYALMDIALGGYHAKMFTEVVARERIAKIREVLREEQKAEEKADFDRPHRRGGLRPIAEILRGAA